MIDGDVNLGMTIYDLNKQIISQMGVLDEEGYTKAKDDIRGLAIRTNARYFMLLCKDISYYTLFHIDIMSEELVDLDDEVIDCIHDIGAIKSVEPVDGALEIWAHPVEGEPVAMYLFPYDAGVVECTL